VSIITSALKEITIINKEQITPKHKAEHEPFEYIKYEITERSRDNQCYVCFYDIPPGKAGYPYHYHTANTEVFYIISGNGVVETPDGKKSITAGDVIVCPPDAKGAHKIINTSETDMLAYLDCDTANSPDVVFYPSSGKIGALFQGENNVFFDSSSEVDYYKGE
jgi:uncharacterized cupin superfamily protein